jgi:uncharacterized membrane protein
VEEIQDIVALLIPITAIVMAFGIAFWSIYWGHQKKRLQYQERQLMIEKGLTPPPVLEDAREKNMPENSLRRGIVLLFLGIGLAVGTAILGNFFDDREFVGIVALAAAIVGFIGLGNLVYYFIARRKPEDTARTL